MTRHGRVIWILGDIHGNFRALNDFINRKIRQGKSLRAVAPYWKADGDDLQVIILQCGDFAYFWPLADHTGAIRNQVDFLPGGRVPLYWVGGNHENWDRLDCLFPKGSVEDRTGIVEVDHGVFFCRFGSTLEIAPDVTVLFAGGAESSDRDWRLREMAAGSPRIWWPQEGINDADMARLAAVPKADWVVSHNAPHAFDVGSFLRPSSRGYCEPQAFHMHEPSRGKLEEALVRYHPRRWFFGHFHKHMSGRIDGCDWECLDMAGGGGQWNRKVWLEWSD